MPVMITFAVALGLRVLARVLQCRGSGGWWVFCFNLKSHKKNHRITELQRKG